MRLEEYLEKHNIAKSHFAKLINISRNHLHDIIAGRKMPSRGLAKKIEETTDGQVSAMELLFPEE